MEIIGLWLNYEKDITISFQTCKSLRGWLFPNQLFKPGGPFPIILHTLKDQDQVCQLKLLSSFCFYELLSNATTSPHTMC